MKKLLLLSLLFSAFAFAAEVPSGTVEVDPKVYPEKAFRKHKNIQVKALPKRVPHPDALPDKEQREAVFARVPGLESYVKNLDELDRDMLYMRARHGTAAELQEKHPSIPQEILARLQAEAKKP